MRVVIGLLVVVAVVVAGWQSWAPSATAPVLPGNEAAPSAAMAVTLPAPSGASAQGPAAAGPPSGLPPTDERREAARVVQVRVVDAFDQPVAGAQVELQATLTAEPFAAFETDASGRCALPVLEDVAFVRATHDDVGSSVRREVRPLAADDEVVVLMLLRPVVVRGLVLARDAKPMPGAVLRIEVKTVWPTALTHMVSMQQTITDATGRFALDAMLGTTLRLVVDEARGQASQDVEVNAASEVLVACSGAFGIEGVAVDEQGQSVVATVSKAEPWPPGQSIVYFQDAAAAQFSLTVEQPGRYLLTATAEGYCTPTIEVMLSLEQPRARITIVMVRGLPTRGVVVHANGLPVAAAFVAAETTVPGWGRVFAECAEDGTFALRLPKDTAWSLECGRNEPVPCQAGDQNLRFVLLDEQDQGVPEMFPESPRQAVVEVELEVYTEDLRPAVFPWLQWVSRVGDTFTVSQVAADNEGHHFHLKGIVPGGRPCLAAMDAVTNQTGFLWIEPPYEPQRLVLQPQVPLTVSVRHRGGPARAVVVDVEPCGLWQQQRVDATGRTHFVGIAHGPAVVKVLRGVEVLARRAIELRPGQRPTLTIGVDLSK